MTCRHNSPLLLYPGILPYMHSACDILTVSSFIAITRPSKFSSVQSLLLHFSSNYGADSTVIYYIGFQGEFKEVV